MMKVAILLSAGIASGLLTAWVYVRFGDPATARIAGNRMLAHLMEFRLFIDEPALVLRAHRDLLRANFELLRALLRPTLILMAPFALLAGILQACFGVAPLPIGEPAVLTVANWDGQNTQVQAPPGIAIETEGVRAPGMHQISFRLRPLKRSSGFLRITEGPRVIHKRIVAGAGWPFEWPFPDSVELRYPKARVLGWHWWIWYGLGLFPAALLVPLQSSK